MQCATDTLHVPSSQTYYMLRVGYKYLTKTEISTALSFEWCQVWVGYLTILDEDIHSRLLR